MNYISVILGFALKKIILLSSVLVLSQWIIFVEFGSTFGFTSNWIFGFGFDITPPVQDSTVDNNEGFGTKHESEKQSLEDCFLPSEPTYCRLKYAAVKRVNIIQNYNLKY